jgi:hypothetical protein
VNNDTLLHRQVHPSFVTLGRISSQVFRPTPKDEKLLSVYDGDLISPEDAWKHFTSTPNCKSVGVMSVSVAECTVQKLPYRPDPACFPEHAVIDFTSLNMNVIERLAKYLRDYADVRGWQYQAQPM